jgi:hypothetical protein
VAKLKPNEKRVQLSFQREEDVALYERLEKMAYERRYDLGTFVILALQEAFREEEPNEKQESLRVAEVSQDRSMV